MVIKNNYAKLLAFLGFALGLLACSEVPILPPCSVDDDCATGQECIRQTCVPKEPCAAGIFNFTADKKNGILGLPTENEDESELYFTSLPKFDRAAKIFSPTIVDTGEGSLLEYKIEETRAESKMVLMGDFYDDPTKNDTREAGEEIGVFVEARLKIDAKDDDLDCVAGLSLWPRPTNEEMEARLRATVCIGKKRIGILTRESDTKPLSSDFEIQIDVSEFHVYRLVYIPESHSDAGVGEGERFEFWVDNQLQKTIAPSDFKDLDKGSYKEGGPYFAIEARSAGTTSWDYVRWGCDPQGGYCIPSLQDDDSCVSGRKTRLQCTRAAKPERCNYKDDDCDGQVDEDYKLGGKYELKDDARFSVSEDSKAYVTRVDRRNFPLHLGESCGVGVCDKAIVVCGKDEKSLVCAAGYDKKPYPGKDVIPYENSEFIDHVTKDLTLPSIEPNYDQLDLEQLREKIYESEPCDGLDNNCDGIVDEPYRMDLAIEQDNLIDPQLRHIGVPNNTWYHSDDGTSLQGLRGKGDICGVGACSSGGRMQCRTDGRGIECSNRPKTVELCGDLIDNDCNGATDEGVDVNGDGVISIDESFDKDGDGVQACDCAEGQCSLKTLVVDCNDNDKDVYPAFDGKEAALEICDGKDNDCNGLTDEDTGKSKSRDQYSGEAWENKITWDEDKNVPLDRNGNAFFCDYDEDGFLWNGRIDRDTGEAIEIDCNDYDNEIYPGSYEKCDGKDNDCNGSVDEKSDLDKDGYKSCRSLCPGNNDGTEICDADCDDTRATVHPGTIEVCNAIDDNCDGIVDEGFILLGKDDKPVLNEENGLIYNHLNHCGACNNRCKVFNVKNAICDNGFCSYDECKEGFIDLDGDRTNGCEQSVECDYAVLGASCLSIGRECYKPMYPSENGTQSHCRCEGVWTYLMDDKGNGSVKCIVNDENEGEIIPPAACAVAQRNGMLPELCNGEDDNCDGRIDEDFWGADGKLSTIENCGACGVKCNFDQVNPETGEIESAHVDAYACIDGQCAIDVTKENKGCAKGYVNGDRIDANGCELACTPTEKAKLDSLDDTCDGIDDNCDGQIDEHAECNDNLHCGNFETSCESKHGRRYCLKTIEGYVCQEDGCNDGYGECISTDDEYCETDVTTPVNCGKCGEVCPSSTDTCSCADGAETCRNRDRICTCGKEGGECSGAKPFCHNGECYECTTDDDCFKPDIQRSIAGGVDPVTPIPAYCSNYVCHTCVRGDPFDVQHNGKYVCDPLSDKPICRRSIRSGMTWYSCGGCQTRFECSEVAEKAEVVEITDLPEKTPEGKSGLKEWSLWLKRNGFCETEPCCAAVPEGEASEESEAEPCPAALAPADQNQILDRNALVKQYKQLILSQGICNPVKTNISDEGEVEGITGGNCVQCIRKDIGQYDGCPENAPICASVEQGSVEQGEDGPTHCVPCVSGDTSNTCPNGLSCSNGKCIGCGDDFNGCKDTPSTPICGYSGMPKPDLDKTCSSSAKDSDCPNSSGVCISKDGLLGIYTKSSDGKRQCAINGTSVDDWNLVGTSVDDWNLVGTSYIQYDVDKDGSVHFHFAEFLSSSERACRACWFNEDCALRAEVLPDESKPKQFEFQCVSGRCQVCNPFTNDGCQGNEICGCDPNSSACSKYECIPVSMDHCSALGVGCDVDTANECDERQCKCGNAQKSEVCGGHYPFCLWDKKDATPPTYSEKACAYTTGTECEDRPDGTSKKILCSKYGLSETHVCDINDLCQVYCRQWCDNDECRGPCLSGCSSGEAVDGNGTLGRVGASLVDLCVSSWKQEPQEAEAWCDSCCPPDGDHAQCVKKCQGTSQETGCNSKTNQCCWYAPTAEYVWQYCNTPRCVNCRTDEDCHGGDICVAHECRACQPFEADQSNDTGATPLVSQEQKNCSPESAAPICDSESFTCRACSTDTECIYASGGALGYCNHTLGRCQVCNPADSKGCSAEKPICNLTPNGYACAVCENSEECNARSAGLICSSGKCEACESSANCRKKQDNWVHPNGSVCIGTGSAKHCGKCEKDDDCSASGNDGQFCFDGACVECRSNSDCATNANGNVCKNHVCGGCDDASDCEGHDAGSYCTATKSGLSICAPCNKEHGGCSEQNPICAEKTLTADNGQEYHSFACDTCDENEHNINNDGTNSSCVARDGGRFPYCNSGICTYCNEAQLTGTAHDQGCTDSEPICVLDGKSSGLCRACDASKAECNGMTNAARCTLGNVSCTDGSVPSCKGSEVDSKVVCSAGGVAICTDGKNGTGAPVPDGKPVCVTASACYLGECRECSQQTSLDCGDTKKHACNANGICEPCSSHSDCDHYCYQGQCGSCEPGTNAGCSNALQPICDASLECVDCNADVDAETLICAEGKHCCPAGLHCILAESLKGSCVECVAEGRNAECPEDAPICTDAHQCKVCETDTECYEKAICKNGKCGESGEGCSADDEGKECIAKKNLCVAGRCGAPGVVCHSSDDCGGRVCNLNTHLCQDCFGDDDCLGNGAGQQCVDGVCSQCNPQTHAGCSGKKPICKKDGNSLACQACSGNADCATNASVGNVCKDGECFGCFAEQDGSQPYDRGCSLQQPVCDGTTNTCRACDSDGECKDYCPTGDCTKEGAQPYCVSLAGGTGMSCHACKPNSAGSKACGDGGSEICNVDIGCSDGAPICDPYTGTCRGCHSNDDCPTSTPFCDTNAHCVRCISHQTHPVYSQHSGCNENQLCNGTGSGPVCVDISLNQCFAVTDGACNTGNADSGGHPVYTADHCVNRACVCGDTGDVCPADAPHCSNVVCEDGSMPYCTLNNEAVPAAILSCNDGTVTCSSGTAACASGTPKCRDKSVCLQCRDSGDCGDKQRCENGVCTDITLKNCTAQGGACNENTANVCDASAHQGTCKCGSANACSGYCAKSNDDTYRCVTCISNNDCKDGNANKLCNAAGNCVACTAGQACSDCASDTDCQNGTTKWFCDPGDNHCHECVSDVDNGVVDGVSPACTTGDAQCVNGEVTCSDAIGTAYCTTGSPSCDAGKPVCVQRQCVNHTWQDCDPNGDIGCETCTLARSYGNVTCSSGTTALCVDGVPRCKNSASESYADDPTCASGELVCVNGDPKCVVNDCYNVKTCTADALCECRNDFKANATSCEQQFPCSDASKFVTCNSGNMTCRVAGSDGYSICTCETADNQTISTYRCSVKNNTHVCQLKISETEYEGSLTCHVDYTGKAVVACNDAQTGYALKDGECVDINECDEDAPTHACHCDPASTSNDCKVTCTNVDGKTDGHKLGYTCGCNPSKYYKLADDGITCVDINECEDQSNWSKLDGYRANATCVNTLGGYTWKCNPGYTKSANGELCVDINECALGTHTCPPSLHCLNNEGGFTCEECTSSEHCSASEKGSYCSEAHQCTCLTTTNEGCGGDWKCTLADGETVPTCKDCNSTSSCDVCTAATCETGDTNCKGCDSDKGEYCNALGYCDNRTGCETQADCNRSGTSNDKGNSQLYCNQLGAENLCVECLYAGHCGSANGSLRYEHIASDNVESSTYSVTSGALSVRSKNGAVVITENNVKKDTYPKDGCVASLNNSDQKICGCYEDGHCQSGYVCRRDPGDSTTAYSHCVECNTADDCAYKVGKPGEGCVNHKCEPLENLSESCHEEPYGVGANAYKISTHSACNGEKRKFCATAEGKNYCVECSGNTRLVNNDLVSVECGHGENDSGLMCRVDVGDTVNPSSITSAEQLKNAYCGCKDAYSCTIGGCRQAEHKCFKCSDSSDCVYVERKLKDDGSFESSSTFEAYGLCLNSGACIRCGVTEGYNVSDNKYDQGCFSSASGVHYDSLRPVCTTASNGASEMLACSECEPGDFNFENDSTHNGPDCKQNKHCIVREDNSTTGIYTCEECDKGYYREDGSMNSLCHIAEPEFTNLTYSYQADDANSETSASSTLSAQQNQVTVESIPESFTHSALLTLTPVCSLQNSPISGSTGAISLEDESVVQIECHKTGESGTVFKLPKSLPKSQGGYTYYTFTTQDVTPQGYSISCDSEGCTPDTHAICDATGHVKCDIGETCESLVGLTCLPTTATTDAKFELLPFSHYVPVCVNESEQTIVGEIGTATCNDIGVLTGCESDESCCSKMKCVQQSQQAHIKQIREYMGGLTCDVRFTCVNSTDGIALDASPKDTLTVTMTFSEKNENPSMTWDAPSDKSAYGVWGNGTYQINGALNDRVTFTSKVNDKDLDWDGSKTDVSFENTPRGLQALTYSQDDGCNDTATIEIPQAQLYISGNNGVAAEDATVGYVEGGAQVSSTIAVTCKHASSDVCSQKITVTDETDELSGTVDLNLNVSCAICINDKVGTGTFSLHADADRGCGTTYRYCTGEQYTKVSDVNVECVNNAAWCSNGIARCVPLNGDIYETNLKPVTCGSGVSCDSGYQPKCVKPTVASLACSQCNGSKDGFTANNTAGDANTGINSTCGANSICSSDETTHVFTCGCKEGYSPKVVSGSADNTQCLADIAQINTLKLKRGGSSSDVSLTGQMTAGGKSNKIIVYAQDTDSAIELETTCQLVKGADAGSGSVNNHSRFNAITVATTNPNGATISTSAKNKVSITPPSGGKIPVGTYKYTFICDNAEANEQTNAGANATANPAANDVLTSTTTLEVTLVVNNVPQITAGPNPPAVTLGNLASADVKANVDHVGVTHNSKTDKITVKWEDIEGKTSCKNIAQLGASDNKQFTATSNSSTYNYTSNVTCVYTDQSNVDGTTCYAGIHVTDDFGTQIGGANGEDNSYQAGSPETGLIAITCKYCNVVEGTDQGCTDTLPFCTTHDEATYTVGETPVCLGTGDNSPSCGAGNPKCAPTDATGTVLASALNDDVTCSGTTATCVAGTPVCAIDHNPTQMLACSQCSGESDTSHCGDNKICAVETGYSHVYRCSQAELNVKDGNDSAITEPIKTVVGNGTLKLKSSCDLTPDDGEGVQGTRRLSADVKFTRVDGGSFTTAPKWTSASTPSFSETNCSGTSSSNSKCWTRNALENEGAVGDELVLTLSEAGTYTVDFTCDNGGSTPRTYATGSVTIYVNGVPHVTFDSNSGPGSLNTSTNTLTLTSGMAATTVKVLHGHGANIGTDDSTDPATDVEVGSLKYEYDVCVVTDDTNVSDACPAPSASPSPAPPANGSNTINPPANIPASGSSSDSDPTPSSAPANADESAMVPKQETPGSPG